MRPTHLLLAFHVAFLVACGAPPPAVLEFVDLSPESPRVGEIATIRFRAIDSRGLPMAGVQVNFKIQGGPAGLVPTPAQNTTNKGDGIVATQVTVSSRVTGIVVQAEAQGKAATSPPISFAGALPNARQLTFQCGEIGGESSGGIHAIQGYDSTRHLVAGLRLRCIAHVGDRNGDGVSGALVSFMTEAGTIGPTESSQTDGVGNAPILYKTSLPLPEDVTPGVFTWTPPTGPEFTGEYLAPLWMHPFLWIENPVTQFNQTPTLREPRRADPIRPGLTLNPRDNLVTLIAVTSGEESFDDQNNNGRFDVGEPFEDLTEPFVDSNDSGTWEKGERWIDANNNGVWDRKNGAYDSNGLIWVSERILWTGFPHGRDVYDPNSPVLRVIEPAGPVTITHFGEVPVRFLLADPWFNTIAANDNSDGCTSDADIVLMVPRRVRLGVRNTYPSFEVVTFTLRDIHDPTAVPPPAAFNPPVNFSTRIACAFSGTQMGGPVVSIPVLSVSGTVQ